MHKTYLITGALLGALGAHGLQQVTTDARLPDGQEKILHGFNTAVQYQMYHALALLTVAIIYERFPGKWIKWAGNFFIIGIILFSGSLYLLTALKISESDFTKIVGPITPIGGVFYIIGWLALLFGVLKKK